MIRGERFIVIFIETVPAISPVEAVKVNVYVKSGSSKFEAMLSMPFLLEFDKIVRTSS